jgi:pimeloyl-ACP methyl ester carboxylesterase
MSLGADEFRAHLELAANTAGVRLAEIVLPGEHHLLRGRMRLHYLDWGTAGLPPVVFLHGGGLNAHTWDLVCAALRQERHCLALDQRGHGESEWSPEMDYSTESHVGDLEAFLQTLGLQRFVLVGMSLRGVNALAWAGRHSRRLAGLVLVDVGPEIRVDGARKIAAFTSEATPLDSVEQFVDRALAFNPRRNRELLRRSLLHNLRRMPDGRWCGSTTSATAARSIPMPTRAGASCCGRPWRPSSAPPWSCAGPRATCSTTRTPSAWPVA